jgi:hypothetical protein
VSTSNSAFRTVMSARDVTNALISLAFSAALPASKATA